MPVISALYYLFGKFLDAQRFGIWTVRQTRDMLGMYCCADFLSLSFMSPRIGA